MDKKAVIVGGPTLIMINLFAILIAGVQLLFGYGLVLGALYNSKLRKEGFKAILPKVLIFSVDALLVITSISIIIGPLRDHRLPMLIGAIPFAAILTLLSMQKLKEDPRPIIINIGISTLIYIIISQLAIFIAAR